MEEKDICPIVFVHGLGGWGADAAINRVLPYWGMRSGDIMKELGRRGFECYAASVGPASSAWDRACELYAQLAGGRVDYGAAHAAAHSHARFGRTYARPLVPGWADGRKIHLVGHSFGGATIRLFVQLLEKGSAEERNATQRCSLSPLFGGLLNGHVFSVTTLGAPHNGSTAFEPQVGCYKDMQTMLSCLAYAVHVLPGACLIYPFRLEHLGISRARVRHAPWRIVRLIGAFNGIADSAKTDLTVDGAAALNKAILCQPGIYYFSYAACSTQDDDRGNQISPYVDLATLRKCAAAMGLRRPPYCTAGGIPIDDAWLPNDGQVSVISALHPFNEPHQDYDPAALCPGVWQVMPIIEGRDHADLIGGMRLWGGCPDTLEFYVSLAEMLEGIQILA